MFEISTKNGSAPIPEIMRGLFSDEGLSEESKLEKLYADALEERKKTSDGLPEIGSFYRANLTGIVFEVVKYAIVQNSGMLLIILRALRGEATIMVPVTTFSETINADQAYDYKGVGPCLYKKLYENIEVTLEDDGSKPESVEALPIEKVQERLASKKKRLYVINTFLTKHGLPDILFEFLAEGHTTPSVCKIPATWIPIDILSLVPRQALLNNQNFQNLVRNGRVKTLRKRDYKKIMALPEAQQEMGRVQQLYEEFREADRSRPIQSEMTNSDEVN